MLIAEQIISMILQNFELSKGDLEYQLRVKNGLTIKPEGFTMRVKLKKGKRASSLLPPA